MVEGMDHEVASPALVDNLQCAFVCLVPIIAVDLQVPNKKVHDEIRQIAV